MNALILDFLKTNGEGLDADIARALHLPVSQGEGPNRPRGRGDLLPGDAIRRGKKIEGICCRLSGNLPTPARGPKPGKPSPGSIPARGSNRRAAGLMGRTAAGQGHAACS